MQVETFEQTEETIEGKENASNEEAIKLIEEMGLVGQKEKVVSGVVRCPYRQMAKTEERVYQTLYPEVTPIEKYDAGMIPLRVLQVASHAKALGLYDCIEVWGERTKPIDPILVGRIGSSISPKERHILARWGNALESFDVLYEKARIALAKKMKAKLESKISECQAKLPSVEAMAISDLDGEWVNVC